MFNHLLSQGGRLLAAIPMGAASPAALVLPVVGYLLLSRDVELHVSVRKAQTA